MADIRPFRGLRFDTSRVDPALAIAPPYDVISAADQAALYDRSPYNIVRIEYGDQRATDSEADNRYTRAARDLRAWRDASVLVSGAVPALYAYAQGFEWARQRFERRAVFAAVRLEEWDKGIIKPHEHTLATPKADRMHLLRATRTQVSPVYSIVRPRAGRQAQPPAAGAPLVDCTADGQRHVLASITDAAALAAYQGVLADSDVYIADGHHRYETALAYRDEVRAQASAWTGEEAENFVLMALTQVDDPGLLVLPTHRIIHRMPPPDALARIGRRFRVEDVAPDEAAARLAGAGGAAFVAVGRATGKAHLLTLSDRAGVEALMPADESPAWKQLDVNVLQYGILLDVFGIDDAALKAGGAVSYTQSADEAMSAVRSGEAQAAFLLNATPVEQVLAVADAGGRMPQKSTYFYPKLPTGLVMRALDDER